MQKRLVHVEFKNGQFDTFYVCSTKKVAEQTRHLNTVLYVETFHNGYFKYEKFKIIN